MGLRETLHGRQMESTPGITDILTTPEARVVILLTVLAVLSAIGWYVVSRYRDQIKDEETVSDLMSEFGEMHDRGDLSSAEYRTIKSMLAEKLRDELDDAAESN
jgi:hypothetical protein